MLASPEARRVSEISRWVLLVYLFGACLCVWSKRRLTQLGGRKLDLQAASLQIYSLREALRELRSELSTARGQAAVDALQTLPRLPVDGLAGLSSTKPTGSIDSSLYSLLGELSNTMAAPVMVDISHTAKGAPPVKFQLAQEAARVHRLREKGAASIACIEKSFKERHPGTSIRSFGRPEVQRALAEMGGLPAAVIKMPTAMAKSKGGTYRVTVGLGEFQAIHAEFVR
jgi:hypothetical protein